jgi:hypothetical protein
MAFAVVLSVLLIVGSTFVDGAQINIRNQCGQTITACDAASNIGTQCYVLNAFGGSRVRDVGGSWTAGLVWGFPGTNTDPGLGNQAKTAATKMEMTVNGAFAQDYYDLSNIDGYNLPLLVNPTFIARGGQRSGLHCGTPICNIPNINQVCGSPNYYTGYPAYGCKNVDGGGTSATQGTQFFKNPCQSSYSYSSDNNNVVYACETGSNYEVVFCP